MDLFKFISPALRLSSALQRQVFHILKYFFPLDTGFVSHHGLLQLWPHWDTFADDLVNHG